MVASAAAADLACGAVAEGFGAASRLSGGGAGGSAFFGTGATNGATPVTLFRGASIGTLVGDLAGAFAVARRSSIALDRARDPLALGFFPHLLHVHIVKMFST